MTARGAALKALEPLLILADFAKLVRDAEARSSFAPIGSDGLEGREWRLFREAAIGLPAQAVRLIAQTMHLCDDPASHSLRFDAMFDGDLAPRWKALRVRIESFVRDVS